VPLLFYAPGLTDQKRVDHRVGSNMDLLPSVIGLLGMDDAPHAAWGRSLFNDHFADGGMAVVKMSTGTSAVAMARGDKVLVLGSATGKPQLSRFSLGFPPALERVDEPELAKSMERDLRGYVQAALSDLANRRAGPREADPD
jgi:phosphoglycerol transferase MdoB-like AlkP superfamily enzyme